MASSSGKGSCDLKKKEKTDGGKLDVTMVWPKEQKDYVPLLKLLPYDVHGPV